MNYTLYYYPSSFCKFLIDDTSKFSHLYGDRLANHLPMSLVALDAMGATESQIRWFTEFYQKRLEIRDTKVTKSVSHISDILWKSDSFEGAVSFFLQKIHHSNIHTVLTEYIDLLTPGISASAFHALIRLSYGIEIQSPNEVAIWLAYLTTKYQFVGEPSSSSHDTPEDCMSRTHAIVWKIEIDRSGIIADYIYQVSHSALFHPFLTVSADISIDSIADITLNAYLASHNNFTLLHGVTATHALRSILPFSWNRQRMLEYFWIAFVAAYMTTGERYAAYAPRQIMIDGDEYFDIQKKLACESLDDHTIKLTYTTWREWQRSGDTRYIEALQTHYEFPEDDDI